MTRFDVRAARATALICPALAWAAPLAAQTAPRIADDAIVVTGSRAPDPAGDRTVSAALTVVDAEALDRRQIRDLADVLRDVPGIAVGETAGQTQLRLRGTEANHVLVLVDGIEASDPFTGEFDFSLLAADPAARIEVLRGPQSALYGSDALGGVINYVTASGRAAPGLSARVEAGSFGTINGALRVAGAAGALDYALSATANTTDGTPDARGGSRDLGRTQLGLGFKGGWQLSENAGLTLVLRHNRNRGDFNNSDSDPASPSFGLQIDSPGNRFETEASYGLLRADLAALHGRWTHALSGQFADTRRDTFGPDGRTFGSEGGRLKGSYETAFRFDTGAVRHQLTAAADVEGESFRNTDPFGFAFTGTRRTRNIGLVGQYDLFLGEATHVGGAVRRDWNNRFDDTTTWRVQASHRFATGTRLRAAAGTGVKNPGYYELFGYVDGRFIGNPGLKPERSEGWEVGIDQEFADDRAAIGVTWFEARLKDEIFTGFPPPNFIATPGNRDSVSRQEGLEASVRLRPAEGLRLDAAYTLLNAREDGMREVRRPQHSGSIVLDWRAPDARGGANLAARYVGPSRDVAFTDPSYVPVPVRLDDHVLLTFAADVALTENISLFGRIENLTDERYEAVFSFVSRGRSALVGASARF